VNENQPTQRCHLCGEEIGFEATPEVIEHFRLFHPEFHETVRRLVDQYLEHQFQQLTPEDFDP